MLAASSDFPPAFTEQVRFYTVNALREIGRWEEAETQLLGLIAEADARAVAAQAVNPHVVSEQYGPNAYYQKMLLVIRDHDADRTPIALMGDRWAQAVCANIDDIPPAMLAGTNAAEGCARREQRIALEREAGDLGYRLSVDPKQFTALCERKSAGERSTLEEAACLSAVEQQEWDDQLATRTAEVAQLMLDTVTLDTRCEAVTIGRYDSPATALGQACQDRNEELRSAESERLVALMTEQPGEYETLCTWEYPDSGSDDPLETACASIKMDRDWAEDEREREAIAAMAPGELDARCSALWQSRNDADRSGPLWFKCSDLREKREEAEWAALEADPAKLEVTCAMPFDELPDGIGWRCGFRKDQQLDAAAWELARDHASLVSACQSTPGNERSEILYKACQNYRKCLILPIGIRLPAGDADVRRGDYIVGLLEGDEDDEVFFKGPQGDGTASYCYDTVAEASAVWELVKDPANRVVETTKREWE